MSKSDSTVKFVKPARHIVVPLCCPACGSGEVKPYQAVIQDDDPRVPTEVVVAAHFRCDDCKTPLMIRVDRHAVSLKWATRTDDDQ